jgi:hypothetical protein
MSNGQGSAGIEQQATNVNVGIQPVGPEKWPFHVQAKGAVEEGEEKGRITFYLHARRLFQAEFEKRQSGMTHRIRSARTSCISLPYEISTR